MLRISYDATDALNLPHDQLHNEPITDYIIEMSKAFRHHRLHRMIDRSHHVLMNVTNPGEASVHLSLALGCMVPSVDEKIIALYAYRGPCSTSLSDGILDSLNDLDVRVDKIEDVPAILQEENKKLMLVCNDIFSTGEDAVENIRTIKLLREDPMSKELATVICGPSIVLRPLLSPDKVYEPTLVVDE